jgi:hypothetical protein
LDKEVWAMVLDRKSEDHEVWVVINNGTVMHRNPQFAEHTVRKFELSQIRKRVPAGRQRLIRITTAAEDDTILDIRRVDGKTTPLFVQVDKGDEAVIYVVDHTGKVRL